MAQMMLSNGELPFIFLGTSYLANKAPTEGTPY